MHHKAGIKLMTAAFLMAFLFSLPSVAFAHCPLCTAATGLAVGMTRFYGIDDLIVGSLIGAFTISTGLWMNNWLLKRHKGKSYIPWQASIVTAVVFITTVASFALFSFGLPVYYKLFGIDKLLIGVTLGSITTIFAFIVHKAMRSMNGDKNYLPAQGIALVFLFLTALNAGFYAAGWIY